MRSTSLFWALAVIGGSLLLFAAVEIVLMVVGPVEPTWLILAFPLMGLTYGATGIEAWRRRPSNRIGLLLVLGAWCWLLAGLANVEDEVLIVVGQLAATVGIAVIVHLVLAFPPGRLPDRASRWISISAYVTTTVFEVPLWLFNPSSPAMIRDHPDLDRLAHWFQRSLGAVIFVAFVVVVVRRLMAAPPPARRVLAPLLGYGVFTAVMVPVSANVLPVLVGIDPLTLATIQLAVLMVVPLAFTLGLLRGGFAQTGELVELGASLGADLDRPELAAALSATLGDPSVEVGFWLPGRSRYVDAAGRPLDLAVGRERRRVDIDVGGRPVGVIGYDATLLADADLVRTAGRVVAIAIDRQRLDVELRASYEALRTSRARIVEAGDAERRRIARDLHDGLQGRLVLLAIRAQRLVDRVGPGDARDQAQEVRFGMDAAIEELRALVHGVMPALLIERGLEAATAELVDRMPIPTELAARVRPLPASVESTAYLVVAESLANGVKHSRADHMWVRLDVIGSELCVEIRDDGVGGAATNGGSGLRGITDRVDALGGRVDVDSPAGRGTVVRVEVPCGS